MTTTTTDTTATGSAAEAELLLKAGAVLPVGTDGAGPSAVDLTARTYRHPALPDGRVVVRLAAAELGPAEDLAAGFLGLVPDEGEPPVVGLGQRQALGFPEWVLVHHPEDGHHALAVVPELDRVARQAKTKPKAALDACHELAGRLAAAVPHFLPVFYEQAARLFLAVENTAYASQLFGRARTAEARHGLTVDEDRLDAVFLEFALVGALPVKVLTGYAKDLSARVSPAEAHTRFRRLCVRRTAGGLPPSAQAATELRRLARAAGLTGSRAEQEYLAELLPLPATLRAAYGWWKAHRTALIALAHREPAVRGTLLELMPPGNDGELSDLWLEILEESGATEGLVDTGLPAEQRCADGAAGWLERYHAARHSGWRQRPTPPALLDLVTRAADRLRTELAEPGREAGLRIGVQDVDLLDLLLSLGIPVADPEEDSRSHHRHNQLNVADWARADQRRDLLALAADRRFRPAFRRAANSFGDAGSGGDVMRRLAASPGGRPMLTEWMQEVARNSKAAGLPGLPEAISRLTWLPAEALELAREEVADAAAADLGAILARTLRGGLFEEYAWPAFEEALTELADRKALHRNNLTVVEAWPHLIVANSIQVRVIDADSTVLTHDLRVPTGSSYQYGFHYVDGALLVFWSTWGSDVQGYWHTDPQNVFTLKTDRNHWSLRSDEISLPLPGGGRTVGGGVLHVGDTELPPEQSLLCDGTSYWVWRRHEQDKAAGWCEYNPADGSHGRFSQPAFLTDTLNAHPSRTGFAAHSTWLRPAPTVEGSALGTPADGLLGWCAVRVKDEGWYGRDTAGRTVHVPADAHKPAAALALPGDDRPRALTHRWRELSITDPDGVVTVKTSGDHRNAGFATGSIDLPPLPFWYALRPRDPEGSAALRAADRDTVAALLKAAAAAEKASDLPGLVSAAFPQITAPELLGGIIEVLRFALTQQKALDGIAARLDSSDAGATREPEGPTDQFVEDALRGVIGTGYYHWGAQRDVAHQYLHRLAAGIADTGATAVPGRLHFDTPALEYSRLPFTPMLDHPAAVAYRAVAPGTTDEQRAALCGLLGTVDALGLASAAGSADRWRRVVVHLDDHHLRTPDGLGRSFSHRSLLPLGGGAVLALTEHSEAVPGGGGEFGALFHDPSGRFTVPGPYTLRGEAPVGDRERGPGWLTAFLTEAAAHGPAPLRPEAADEFARLTGVSATAAKLLIAGLPNIDSHEHNFLPAELRTALGVKAADAKHARTELQALDIDLRRSLVAALLPADPARLWTDGPDVAAAAELWNRRVGRRTPVPEWLLAETTRAVRTSWPTHRALAAVLDPEASPALGTDTEWKVRGDRVEPVTPGGEPFTRTVLTDTLAVTAWLAHRLPAGHPVRAALPPVLTAVRQRLAAPGLLLDLGYFASLPDFRKTAGTPTETAEGHERYGAVVMATGDDRPRPALRTALLDSTGSDPYLPALRGDDQQPSSAETALRCVHEPRFASLLADPGAPAAGTADKDGTWWPQDPGRSVPELVAEVRAAYGLGADAAVLYLMLLAMPDPTDRNTARWTGWKPARLKAARAELAATDLVVTAARTRAGRTLFLPGPWADMASPNLPVEQWKLPMYEGLAPGGSPVLRVLVPAEPAADLYRRAWQRVTEGDVPRFEELKVKRTRTRRR